MGNQSAHLLADLTSGRPTLLACLRELRDRLRPAGVTDCFYGFFPTLKARSRNETIFVTTSGPHVAEQFTQSGGTTVDWIAARLEHIKVPEALDVVAFAEMANAQGDIRAHFLNFLIENEIRTAWICPIIMREQIGYGVLNHFMSKANAPPPLSPEDMLELARGFHALVRQSGLIAVELGITEREAVTLRMVSLGQDAADISVAEGIGMRAVEARLMNARKKLPARTTAEAVFKAAAYGILGNLREMRGGCDVES